MGRGLGLHVDGSTSAAREAVTTVVLGGHRGHNLHNNITDTVSDARKVGAVAAFETVLSYCVEEEVVGRKEQPRSGPPQHEARPAAAVLCKCSPP